jgi:hypothetical protein
MHDAPIRSSSMHTLNATTFTCMSIVHTICLHPGCCCQQVMAVAVAGMGMVAGAMVAGRLSSWYQAAS